MTVAAASADHPRNSEAAVYPRRDGSLLLIYQEYLASPRGGGDDAPNRLVAVVSNDGGRSWTDKRIVAEPAPDQVNVYSPSLLPSQRGDLLLFHSHLMHRSTDNQSERMRAAMVFHYGEAGTVDGSQEKFGFVPPNVDWMPVLRGGSPVAGA